MTRIVNITGQRFGHLVAIGFSGTDAKGRALWQCRCDCGNVTVKASMLVRDGRTRSCGCMSSKFMIGKRSVTHGESRKGKRTPEYGIWCAMTRRCRNKDVPEYSNYGGRGIEVCDRWLSFENFIADIGRRPTSNHSLDRINVDGHYSPANCRWATKKEQMSNRRRFAAISNFSDAELLAECRHRGLVP